MHGGVRNVLHVHLYTVNQMNVFQKRKRQDSCKRMKKRLNLPTGMFHSHTLNDLSSDVDTNRRFLKNECILFNIVWFKARTCQQR